MSGNGLPGPLPVGERVLWQGAPEWRALARHGLHLRGLSVYLAALVVAVGISSAWHEAGAAAVAMHVAEAAAVASVPVLLGLAYAWAAARAARYTITDRRVVIRLGVALPMTMNLPFSKISAADLVSRGDGTGEIRLGVTTREGMSWMVLWPHARFGHAAPVLRGLRDAERAGQVLGRALAASVDAPVPLASAGRVVENGRRDRGVSTVAA